MNPEFVFFRFVKDKKISNINSGFMPNEHEFTKNHEVLLLL